MTDHPRTPRVLLAELKERTSARGTTYLTGFLGHAKVIAFKNPDEDPEDWKSPTWKIYVQERPERTSEGAERRSAGDAS